MTFSKPGHNIQSLVAVCEVINLQASMQVTWVPCKKSNLLRSAQRYFKLKP